MKQFRTTGACVPERDYRVDIHEKLEQIKVMVDNHNFTIIKKGVGSRVAVY